jgi:hypothetical protein
MAQQVGRGAAPSLALAGLKRKPSSLPTEAHGRLQLAHVQCIFTLSFARRLRLGGSSCAPPELAFPPQNLSLAGAWLKQRPTRSTRRAGSACDRHAFGVLSQCVARS